MGKSDPGSVNAAWLRVGVGGGLFVPCGGTPVADPGGVPAPTVVCTAVSGAAAGLPCDRAAAAAAGAFVAPVLLV